MSILAVPEDGGSIEVLAGRLQKVYHGGLPWDLSTVFFFACTSMSRAVKLVVVLESPGRENAGRGDSVLPDITAVLYQPRDKRKAQIQRWKTARLPRVANAHGQNSM